MVFSCICTIEVFEIDFRRENITMTQFTRELKRSPPRCMYIFAKV